MDLDGRTGEQIMRDLEKPNAERGGAEFIERMMVLDAALSAQGHKLFGKISCVFSDGSTAVLDFGKKPRK